MALFGSDWLERYDSLYEYETHVGGMSTAEELCIGLHVLRIKRSQRFMQVIGIPTLEEVDKLSIQSFCSFTPVVQHGQTGNKGIMYMASRYIVCRVDVHRGEG